MHWFGTTNDQVGVVAVLARSSGNRPRPTSFASHSAEGAPLAGSWLVDDVTLVESTLHGARGSRYTVLERVPLAG